MEIISERTTAVRSQEFGPRMQATRGGLISAYRVWSICDEVDHVQRKNLQLLFITGFTALSHVRTILSGRTRCSESIAKCLALSRCCGIGRHEWHLLRHF